MSNINQLPLWCRQCDEPYTAIGEDGVCDNCGTPNVLERHTFSLLVPVDAYSKSEAHAFISELVGQLISLGLLPESTEVA